MAVDNFQIYWGQSPKSEPRECVLVTHFRTIFPVWQKFDQKIKNYNYRYPISTTDN